VNFLAFALAMVGLAGGLARLAIHLLTLRRRRPPMVRGRVERCLIHLAGLVGGPVPLMLIGLSSGGVAGPNLEEVGMVGLALAMPGSAVSTWFAGELVSGPTRRSWLVLVIAFACAEAGFVAGMVATWLLAVAVARTLEPAASSPIWVHLVSAMVPFIIGAIAGAFAYCKARGKVVIRPRPSPVEQE
jgi:hypothetical protein